MGFNTVAVIYNDTVDMGRTDAGLGERIYRAVIGWHGRDRDPRALDIMTRSERGGGGSYGVIVSQAHADYTQIVAVGQNSGHPITDCHNLDYTALSQMAECLVRHGWTARPPAKRRKSKP